MSTVSRPTFLRRLGRVSMSRRRREPDLADMGTAFALDWAMEQPRYDSLTPWEAVPPAPAVPVAPWRVWLGKKLGA